MYQGTLSLSQTPFNDAISPMLEMGAYECLWAADGATQKRVADRLRANPEIMPSDLVTEAEAHDMARWVIRYHRERGVTRFGVRVHRAGEYPERLRDAKHPVEVLQYQGIWELSETRSVAVVGTRRPSDDGIRRTRKLATLLAQHGFTIVSGLAMGWIRKHIRRPLRRGPDDRSDRNAAR